VKSSEIDDAIRRFESAVFDEEIIESCSHLQRTLYEQVPQIGLYFRTNSLIYDENIMGITNERQNMVFSEIAKWHVEYYYGD